MSNRKYFVNNGGQNMGPYEMEIIVQKIESTELKATDHVYVDEKGDWVMICQHPEFLAHAAKNRPSPKPMAPPPGTAPVTRQPEAPARKSPPAMIDLTDDDGLELEPMPAPVVVAEKKTSAGPNVATPTGTGDQEWYVLKGKDRFGPFAFLDLVQMLQDKSIFEFDYVWRQGMATWARVAEVAEFSAENIRSLAASRDSKVSHVFFRRKHDRWKYECAIIVHDNSRIWRGRTVELSEGGAGVIMENAMLVPGQNIYIHFKPGAQSRPFNVLCEVVSKRFVKGLKDSDAPIVYGLKFINIHKQDKDELKTLQEAAS